MLNGAEALVIEQNPRSTSGNAFLSLVLKVDVRIPAIIGW